MSINKDLIDTVTILALNPEYHQTIAANPLTKRELVVLQLIVEGFCDREIAHQLAITVGTVKTHVRRILYKFGTDRRTTAAVRALRCGLIK
jgi:LuxR family maltose regulon positive regulatory protein